MTCRHVCEKLLPVPTLYHIYSHGVIFISYSFILISWIKSTSSAAPFGADAAENGDKMKKNEARLMTLRNSTINSFIIMYNVLYLIQV